MENFTFGLHTSERHASTPVKLFSAGDQTHEAPRTRRQVVLTPVSVSSSLASTSHDAPKSVISSHQLVVRPTRHRCKSDCGSIGAQGNQSSSVSAPIIGLNSQSPLPFSPPATTLAPLSVSVVSFFVILMLARKRVTSYVPSIIAYGKLYCSVGYIKLDVPLIQRPSLIYSLIPVYGCRYV